MIFYNLRTAPDGYRITKFDADLNPESSYLIGPGPAGGLPECTCPAGTQPTCRHRQMWTSILPLVNTAFFWDFERSMIVDGDGDPVSYLELEEAKAELQPHSPTVTTPNFDSGDGGSIPPAVATPATSWRRI